MSTTVYSRLICPVLDLPSGARIAFARHSAEVDDQVAGELRKLLDDPQVKALGISFEGDKQLDAAVEADLKRLAAAEAAAERNQAEREAAEEQSREVERLRAALDRAELEHQAEVQAEVERRMAEIHAKQAGEQAGQEPVAGAPLDPLGAVAEPADDATIEAVLAYVGEDTTRAAARLEIEKGRGDATRSTLVEKLTALAG